MSGPLLVVDDLAAGYGETPVLEGVSFALDPGQRIGVLGPNGGGKSTLFKTLLGELEPLSGTFTATGRFGYVPQTERSRLDYPVTALDVAMMGTLSHLPWWKRPGRRDREAARAALARVGLDGRAGAQFGELSGGQRQRVFVARALVQDAWIMLLDEPFTGLDEPSAEQLEELLAQLAGEGRGILIATHDVDQVCAWDRVLCLNRRQVAFGPSVPTLDRTVLEQTYGGSIVAIPGEDAAGAGILPPHHHHHEGH